MHINVNNEEMKVSENCTIQKLLEKRNTPRYRASVWINGHQILQKDYNTRKLEEKDKIRIIRVIGGG